MKNSTAGRRLGFPLAISAATFFLTSLIFPIVAGFLKNTAAIPKWWGIADVTIAFVLAAVVIALTALTGNDVSPEVEQLTYRTYRLLLHAIIVMLVLFFLAGDRIVWINCLTGFAWRGWLLLYALPAWLSVLRSRETFVAKRAE